MPIAPLHPLEPVVRDYAWGSRTVLAELRGRPSPSPGPEAELWFGAHASAPAQVVGTGTSLLELIDADPAATLGAEVAERCDGRLPFLVKLLAAARPLSLQVHPSAAQAREGFEREERRKIARDAPTRSYRDPWPKPELLHALTPVHALCGFRDPAGTIELLDTLAVGCFAPVRAALADRGEAAFGDLLAAALRGPAWDDPADRAETAAAFARVAGSGGPYAAEARWLGSLLERYPDDGGVRVATLLRLVELEPGQALSLPGGNLHAYLQGAGVEVMASSDNVVRGGLTAKHVDVDELLRIVDARTLPPPVVTPRVHGSVVHLPAPSGDFQLERVDLGDGGEVALDRRRGGPEILVAVGGDATVTASGARCRLDRGTGVFVAATATSLQVGGRGQVFRTTVA